MTLDRTTRVLILLLTAFPLAATAQRGSTPFDLSCWQGKSFRTRTARTKTVVSNGTSVYAQVTAIAKSEPDGAQNCSNRVQLFFSHNGKRYKRVFENSKEFEGLGIEIVGWSPNQKRLLFQTRHWPYDSDYFDEFDTFTLEFGTDRTRNLEVNRAVTKFFGDKCEFEARARGWKDDKTIRVLVSRTPETESYEQVFCVKKPTECLFDLETGQVSKWEH